MKEFSSRQQGLSLPRAAVYGPPAEDESHKPNFAFTTFSTSRTEGGSEGLCACTSHAQRTKARTAMTCREGPPRLCLCGGGAEWSDIQALDGNLPCEKSPYLESRKCARNEGNPLSLSLG